MTVAARQTPDLSRKGAVGSAPDLARVTSGRACAPSRRAAGTMANALLAPAPSGAPRSAGRIACGGALGLRRHRLPATSLRGAARRPGPVRGRPSAPLANGPALGAGPDGAL